MKMRMLSFGYFCNDRNKLNQSDSDVTCAGAKQPVSQVYCQNTCFNFVLGKGLTAIFLSV
jgi:hypothetical protein